MAFRTFTQLDCIPNVDYNRLSRLISEINKCYITVPYHNFTHAFQVFQQFLHCHQSSPSLRMFIGEGMRLFTALLACLAHDLNHKGVNNQFYINKKSLKSVIRSEKAVLENMHCSKLFNILRLHPDADIIADWPVQE